MDHYRVRPATLDDADILVRHRIGMFTDMGVAVDTILGDAFRDWLAEMIPSGTYRAWLLESDGGPNGRFRTGLRCLQGATDLGYRRPGLRSNACRSACLPRPSWHAPLRR